MHLPSGVTLDRGQGGLERLVIDGPQAQAHLYLHGAHLTHFQLKTARARPVLWLSQKSAFEGAAGALPNAVNPGKPIRGGVPICFPWFGPKEGDPKAPMHGFARILPWQLTSAEPLATGSIKVTLELAASALTRALWPHDFAARLAVTVGPVLVMELTVRHAGPAGSAAFTFEEALYTYFAVSDVRQVNVTGLEGATFIDKLADCARRRQGPEPIAITGETDRVYLSTPAAAAIQDPKWKRRLRLDKANSQTTVVWNPWIAKAKAMPDFGADEWPQMLCVETANARDNAVTLAPGASHTMRAVIASEAM